MSDEFQVKFPWRAATDRAFTDEVAESTTKDHLCDFVTRHHRPAKWIGRAAYFAGGRREHRHPDTVGARWWDERDQRRVAKLSAEAAKAEAARQSKALLAMAALAGVGATYDGAEVTRIGLMSSAGLAPFSVMSTERLEEIAEGASES